MSCLSCLLYIIIYTLHGCDGSGDVVVVNTLGTSDEGGYHA